MDKAHLTIATSVLIGTVVLAVSWGLNNAYYS